ncbi:fungal-specific transcription factor domain-containing protein [Fomes fomentarius]|nr:fungal-specific transcription factor domain-containing protein [Fomes fomentarius]
MKAPSALQRGMACLCCRKRKMKCDGARPVCSQCSKANRGAECQYYEKKRTSRTQLLQAKITKLEARLRELEAEQSPLDSSSSSGSQSPQIDRASLALQQHDLGLGFDASAFSTPELDHDFLLGSSSDTFQPLDGDAIFDFSSPSSSSSAAGWAGGGLLAGTGDVDEFLGLGSGSNARTINVRNASGGSAVECTWWENDVFCENKQLLLDIFFAHRHQCAFDVHIGRFKAALLLPNAHKPHPSLVDAIYLLACYFSRSPPLTDLEPHFLKRSLRGIADALQYSDRIVHVLQASCLLALYFFWHGRSLEGYYHSSIAARLAVGLGLHQIPSDQFSRAGTQNDVPVPLNASVPLSPPTDQVEYAERLAAFWQIFSVDRAWAVATGLPTALPDDDHPRSEIRTMWPMTIPNDPLPTLDNSLIQPLPDSHLSGSSALAPLRVKAIELFERTARFSASKDDGPLSLETSLSQFARNLSNLRDQQHSLPYIVSTSDLVVMQTLVYTGTIHLYRDTLDIQRQSYEKCTLAANAVTSLIGQLSESDYDLICPIISACWRATAEILLRLLAMHRALDSTNPSVIEQQIDMIVTALQRLGCLFPIASIHATKIQDDRAASRQSYVAPTF